MKPQCMVIAFDTPAQLDPILHWAYSNGLDWEAKNYRPQARELTMENARNTFAAGSSHAIVVDERRTLYQAPLDYFARNHYYTAYTFTHADKLSVGLDCTIPE